MLEVIRRSGPAASGASGRFPRSRTGAPSRRALEPAPPREKGRGGGNRPPPDFDSTGEGGHAGNSGVAIQHHEMDAVDVREQRPGRAGTVVGLVDLPDVARDGRGTHRAPGLAARPTAPGDHRGGNCGHDPDQPRRSAPGHGISAGRR
jgi:hypothetical protein